MPVAEISENVSNAARRKATGAHYTPHALAAFVAVQVVKALNYNDASKIRILDPAVGDGELLSAILHELPSADLERVVVDGFDTDATALSIAQNRLAENFPNVTFRPFNEDFLTFAADHYDNFQGGLFASAKPLYDAIITNPPYVRTQVMGAAESQRLARAFNLTGRVDLYHAFLEAIGRTLKVDGVAGVICSNRFMTTRSGSTVRQRLAAQFNILHVWDLGDTRLFEAAVLPAVLLLKKTDNLTRNRSPSGFSTIYTARGANAEIKAASALEALTSNGMVSINGETFQVKHGALNSLDRPEVPWALSNGESNEWLVTVSANSYCTFGELGKIRVGVKTTADKIFIRSDWDTITASNLPELLKPLITRDAVERFRPLLKATSPQILYTHRMLDGKRKVVDIDAYPKAKRYLNEHRSVLEARHYVTAAGRQWYEIWVPQNPDAWAGPKLVFPDISEKPTFCMDLGGAVVNGDCYWIVPTKSEDLDLLWLALAVGNSSFIEEFYDHKFNNKLYAGRRRFMTQYVEQFPLPDPNISISRTIVEKTKAIYKDLASPGVIAAERFTELDALVWMSFGFDHEEISRKRNLQFPIENLPAKLRKPRKEAASSCKVKVS